MIRSRHDNIYSFLPRAKSETEKLYKKKSTAEGDVMARGMKNGLDEDEMRRKCKRLNDCRKSYK